LYVASWRYADMLKISEYVRNGDFVTALGIISVSPTESALCQAKMVQDDLKLITGASHQYWTEWRAARNRN